MSKYVRVMRSIWTDADWLELPSRSKMVYLQLISQANISKAGVLPTVPRRWASMYPDLDVEDILAAIDDLVRSGFVLVDEETEELLVRTYMRYDEMYAQPNGRKAISAAIDEIVSQALRNAVEEELADLTAKGSVTPSTRNQEPGTRNPEPTTDVELVDRFDDFWQTYPRKTGKAQAVKSWAKLKPDDQEEAIRILPEHVAYWHRTGTATQFIPHPATWINGRRWEDELPSGDQTRTRREAPGMGAVRRLMEEAQNGS